MIAKYIRCGYNELAADTEKYEMWIETFCNQVPDKEIRKQIEMQIKNR